MRTKTKMTARLVVLLCILGTACGGSASSAPFLESDVLPETVAFAEPTASSASDLSSAQAVASSAAASTKPNPSRPVAVRQMQCGVDWLDIIAPTLAHVGINDEIVTTTMVRGGCQTTASNEVFELSVLLEPVPVSALAEVASAREASGSLMGFEELMFTATTERVSSSLLHLSHERLIENRWIALNGVDAIRVEISIDGDIGTLRPSILPVLEELETVAALHQQVHNQKRVATEATLTSEPDTVAVVDALDEVLAHIAETVLLGPLATETGAEAIAFEYAFPENFAALASAREATDCIVAGDGAVCNLAEAGATYRFSFTRLNNAWLLDGFAFEPAE